MKRLLFLISISFLLTDCKKKEGDSGTTPSPNSAVNGKWKYESNINGGCSNLIGTVCEIKNGESTILSLPATENGFKTGEKILSNINQTTSPNNFSAIGYTRNNGGVVQDPNLKVEIVIQANGQEMIQTYPNNACNPNQKWIKMN
ncbi:hypothetical protein [Arsenicibacter rosenii]|uniref:Lipocalin-like domain-containing protein n=1 Tax=Arsenicibacter rosenii TaxID=1750698 RepID=A0A1S2VGR7_9BACT|nr:hypothetical protein [Arsenicibacter rosenii]OIN57610.1 hypothetical protein BLX24_19215 [Arsenicibacter rosenii]